MDLEARRLNEEGNRLPELREAMIERDRIMFDALDRLGFKPIVMSDVSSPNRADATPAQSPSNSLRTCG
jgi:hypothetical protein